MQLTARWVLPEGRSINERMRRVNGSVFIDPEQLHSVSRRFSAVGSDLAHVIKQDAAHLDEAGKPWGEDEEGEQFARQYEPAAQAAMHALVAVALSIPRIGDGLRQMAQSASTNESNLVGQMGPPSLPTSANGSVPVAGGGDGMLSGAVGAQGPSAIARALNPDLYAAIPQTAVETPLGAMTQTRQEGQR